MNGEHREHAAAASGGLSGAEIAHYRNQGYVIPAYRLDAEQVSDLAAALERVLERNPGVRPEKLVNVHVSHANAEGVLGDEAFLALAHHRAILDCVEAVIGPNIVLWGCQAFCKPGGDGMAVPMHQDGQYWPIRPLATCTVWIAIDDVDAENGCMQVVPGSHREARLYHHDTLSRSDVVLTQRVTAEALSDRAVVDITLAAGQMSLHDVHLIHGSNANRSARRRAGIAIRYMPASSVFERDLIAPGDASGYVVDFSQRPLWLVRGCDVSARNDFVRGH